MKRRARRKAEGPILFVISQQAAKVIDCIIKKESSFELLSNFLIDSQKIVRIFCI